MEYKKENRFPEVCSQAATVCETLRKHHLSPRCVQQQLKPAVSQSHYPQSGYEQKPQPQ